MKRHYEIMRVMRTKVVNFRDLFEGKQGILCVINAVGYRVKDLTSVSVSSSSVARHVNVIDPLSDNFSQQRLDLDKQFQTFAYGIVSPFSPLDGFAFLRAFRYSSNIAIISKLYGLLTTSGVLINKSYHTMMITKIEIFSRNPF